MKKQIGIYYIKCHGKYYVGQSIDIYKRWIKHVSDLNHNRHCNKHLQYAWNKYTSNSFEFKIIKICKEKYLNRFEKLYIKLYDAYKNGYNMTIGGDNQPTSDDNVCQKISLSMIGEKNHFYGKSHTLLSEIEMSKRHNTTGYFRVSKEKGNYKQGFRWRYQYFDKDGSKKAIKSTNINKLKEKVINLSLPWIEFNPI